MKHENRDDWRATGWGALLGALFFLPLVGAAAGALIGLANKKLKLSGSRRSNWNALARK